jgi:tetratricopeptide (TPR) repeat protein
VGQEGAPLTSYDFAADDKPEKAKARVMMRMVKAIDGEYLTQLPSRSEPAVVVTCMTCHRGVSIPRPLDQVVLAAYDSGGVDSAEAKYNALRERYYGRASYVFSETALAAVSQSLLSRGKAADAVKLSALNTRLSPNSAFAFRQAADAQLAAGDTAAAVASLQRALAINPGDQQVKRTLDRLKKP